MPACHLPTQEQSSGEPQAAQPLRGDGTRAGAAGSTRTRVRVYTLMHVYVHARAHTPYLSSLKSLRRISSAFCRNCCMVLPFFICRAGPRASIRDTKAWEGEDGEGPSRRQRLAGPCQGPWSPHYPYKALFPAPPRIPRGHPHEGAGFQS